MSSRFAAIVACLALSGCAIIPGAGPSTWAMRDSAGEVTPAETPDPEAYAFVPMTPSLAVALNAAGPREAAAVFPVDARAPSVGIGPGDEIEVTIVSVNPSGFVDFAQSTVNPVATTTLPPQEIDPSGMINVPPVGRVRAAGLTAMALEAQLTERLSQVLVDPSVLVRITNRISNQAAVIGLVEDPGRYPVEGTDMRVLDLVAAAGGPGTSDGGAARGISTAGQITLTLTRGGRSVATRFDRIFVDPALNVRVWPGDVITLEASKRRYTVFGATTTPEEIEWTDPRLTLAAALGRSRGPDRNAADRRGVFLLRFAGHEALTRVPGLPVEALPDPAPAVFGFDVTVPQGLLSAQQFDVRDGDLIFVSDAPLEEFSKAMRAITGVISPNTVVTRVILPE